MEGLKSHAEVFKHSGIATARDDEESNPKLYRRKYLYKNNVERFYLQVYEIISSSLRHRRG